MKDLNDIINQVARNNKTTPGEVRREIQIIIDSEWEYNRKLQASFRNKPTVEEIISEFALKVNEEN